MRRKAIQLSSNTLVVSLPSKWTAKNSVGKGSDLSVEERGNQLVISPEGIKKDLRRVSFDISKMSSSFLWNLMNSVYYAGFDEVELRFSGGTILDLKTQKRYPVMQVISSICDVLIGMEIIKQSKGYCLLKQVTGLKYEEFDNLMNRLVMSLKIFADDILEAAQSEDRKTLEHLMKYSDVNINKLSLYCQRMLNMMGDRDFLHSNTRFAAITNIEEIGDAYCDIARLLLKKKLPHISLLEDLNRVLDVAMRILLRPSVELFMDFHNKRHALKKQLRQSSEFTPLFERILDLQRDACTMHIAGSL